jgi:hypothetical protein
MHLPGVARGFEVAPSARAKGEDPPGAAFLLRAPEPADGEAAHDPALDLAVTRVQEILADAPLATVGILLRRRAWIPDLIHRLRVVGIAASDEGGNPLTDSAAVLHALSLLHLADHPADLAAAFHVASSPLGKRVGLDADARSAANACDVARGVRAALAQRGYGAYLSSIRLGEGGAVRRGTSSASASSSTSATRGKARPDRGRAPSSSTCAGRRWKIRPRRACA